MEETLYRNKGGVFFLHRRDWRGRAIYKTGAGGWQMKLTGEEAKEGYLVAISTGDAKKWCQDHLYIATYDHIFANMPDTENQTEQDWEKFQRADPNRLTEEYAYSLPIGLAQKVERAAQKNNMSRSRIVEEALVSFLCRLNLEEEEPK